MAMNVYFLKRVVEPGWDQARAAVVVAQSEDDARDAFYVGAGGYPFVPSYDDAQTFLDRALVRCVCLGPSQHYKRRRVLVVDFNGG